MYSMWRIVNVRPWRCGQDAVNRILSRATPTAPGHTILMVGLSEGKAHRSAVGLPMVAGEPMQRPDTQRPPRVGDLLYVIETGDLGDVMSIRLQAGGTVTL
jgi:hypothetical protein